MFSLTRFQDLLKFVPWGNFDAAVVEHGADRWSKRFKTRQHLKAMLYAQLSDGDSLRQLQGGYQEHGHAHYHLGLPAIKRSTLADANRKRNPLPFAAAAQALMQQAGRQVREHRQAMLLLLDSTTISLDGRGFEWAKASRTRNQGLKMHVLMDAHSACPVHQSITPVNVNDLVEGRKLALRPGAVYVFDKGYCDYGWWHSISKAGAVFVTRLKANARLKTIKQRRIAKADVGHVLSDELVQFHYESNRGGHRNPYDKPLRRIQVLRDNGQTLLLISNDLKSPAREIAQTYKQRWDIELLFKWIKQHLNVKSFIGCSENAVRIQLLVALIAYLLIVLYGKAHMAGRSAWEVLIVVRASLMNPITTAETRKRRRRHAQLQALQIPLPLRA